MIQAGQRVASGIFTYAKPKDQLQRNHNKEALTILETKRSQMVIEITENLCERFRNYLLDKLLKKR